MTLIDTFQAGPHAVACRRTSAGDEELLYRIYAGTRTEELAQLAWTDEEREEFLRQQFQAQAHAYRNHYPGAEILIITVDGADAGRLYVHRRPDEIRIMDIALLPDFRGRGIGTALLTRMLQEGAASSRRVTVHVEMFNPAMRLYRRMGFSEVAETGIYRLMEWMPRARGADREAAS